jgi:hypothetical protein
MTEFDDLVARLRAFGSQPVDSAVASEHLTAMAAVRAGRAHPVGRFQRLKVGAAFAAGIVLGGTSLASAGVMGPTVQDKVADAAAHVNVNLPGGTERYGVGKAECAGYTAGTNHGQWVKAHKGDPEAAKSDCGKPVKSVDKAQNDANENDNENGNGAACKPPWAGKGKAAKNIDKAQWRADHPNCAADDQGENENENETTGTANNDEHTPSSTTSSSLTPPSTPDTNAGVPNGGSVPGQNEQDDEHRDGASASTLPPEANGNATQGGDAGEPKREGAGSSTTRPLP